MWQGGQGGQPGGGFGSQPGYPGGGHGGQPGQPEFGGGAQPGYPGPGGGHGGQPGFGGGQPGFGGAQPSYPYPGQGGGHGGQPGFGGGQPGFGAQPGYPGPGGGHGGVMPGYPSQPSQPPFNSGICKIVSAVDGNVLDAEGGAKKGAGTHIIMWHYGDAENQKFNIERAGGDYRITSMVRDKKGNLLALDDATHNNKKDMHVILYDYSGSDNQQWTPVPVQAFGGNEYVLIKGTRHGKCLRNMGHGNVIEMYPESHDDKSQWWKIVPV